MNTTTSLKPGQYERTIADGHRKNGNLKEAAEWDAKADALVGPVIPESRAKKQAKDQIPLAVTIPVKQTNFEEKAYLAAATVQARHWEDLPGWDSRSHLEREHERLWPFVRFPPKILAGNDKWNVNCVNIRNKDLNIIDYAMRASWWLRQREGLSKSEWIWAWCLLIAQFDPALANEFRVELNAMRMTIKPNRSIVK